MKKLTNVMIRKSLAKLPGWDLKGDEIVKSFGFENYYQTMAFVNAVAWISHKVDHHPDLEVGYNKCIVHYSTHSIGGLSDCDFFCAEKIEHLMKI